VCQINIGQLPFVPELLKDIQLIAIFIAPDEMTIQNENGSNWCLRTYGNIADMVPLKQIDTGSKIKDFEMRPVLVDDFPCWDDFSKLQLKENDLVLPPDIEENFASYFDNKSGFKIGGWPTLIQSDIDWSSL